eukprot:sb/3471824/
MIWENRESGILADKDSGILKLWRETPVGTRPRFYCRSQNKVYFAVVHNCTDHVFCTLSTNTRCSLQEPTDTSKQPIRNRYLGHVTSYQPIRNQYFLIRSVPRTHQRSDTHEKHHGKVLPSDVICQREQSVQTLVLYSSPPSTIPYCPIGRTVTCLGYSDRDVWLSFGCVQEPTETSK